MKKFLLLLCSMLAFLAGNTAKAEVILWQEDFSSYEADAVPSGGTYKYVCVDNGSNKTKIYSENLAGGTAPELLIGKYVAKTSDVHGSFSATVPMNGKSGEMVLSFKRNNKSLTVTATGATLGKSTRTGNTDEYPVTVAAGTAEVTFTFTAGSDNVRFDDAKLYQGTALKPAGLSWGTASREAFLDKTNEENKIPVLTNSNNLPVTYGSSDTNVATITTEGAVTLVAEGKTTISAAFAGNTEFEAQTVTYELTVKASEAINTLETALTVAEAHAFITAGENLTSKVYVKGIITKIDDIDTEGTYGNATYYIGDTANDENPLEVYRGFGLDGQKFNEQGATLIKEGDVVVVYGKVKDFNGTHEFDSNSKIVSLNATPAPEPIVFTDQLTVTVNDQSGTLEASVNLIKHEDGTIDFSLPNFVLAYGEDVMPVGNININGLTLVPGEKYDTFEFNDMLLITAGDLEGIDFWMGPALGEMPLKLQGKVNFDDHKLFVNIDIDLSASLSQIINVKFGTDFDEEPAFPLKKNQLYTVNCNRGAWNYNDVLGAATLDATAKSQQFAFYDYEGQTYLWNEGAQHFINNLGKAVGINEASPIFCEETAGGTYRFFFSEEYNINVTGGKVLIDDWTEADEGNMMTVAEVEGFNEEAVLAVIAKDLAVKTFTFTITGAPEGTKVTYGGNEYANGATIEAVTINAAEIVAPEIAGYALPTITVDGTTITIAYEQLPFIVGKTYTFTLRNKAVFYDAATAQIKAGNAPEDENAHFIIGGNATEGYTFYSVGAKKYFLHENGDVDNSTAAATAESEETATRYDYVQDASGCHFKLHGTADNYINERGGTFSTWKSGWGKTDGGGTFVFTEVEIIPTTYTYTIKLVDTPEDGAYLQIGGNWYSNGETVESETELTPEDVTVSCDPAYTYEVVIENGVITVTFKSATVGISGISGDAKRASIFNLQGQRINAAGRGVSIMNGKKVIK